MSRTRLSLDARRGQIVKASMTLFARKGFAGTTTRELARAAGVSEALIFRLFPTKRALYAAIIHRKIAETRGLFDPATGGGESDRTFFHRIGMALLLRVQQDSTFLRLLLYSGLEAHALSDIFFDTQVASVIDHLRRRIAAGIAAGRYRRADPYLAARAFTGMLVQFAISQEIFRLRRKVSPPVDRVVRTFVGLFFEGVEKR